MVDEQPAVLGEQLADDAQRALDVGRIEVDQQVLAEHHVERPVQQSRRVPQQIDAAEVDPRQDAGVQLELPSAAPEPALQPRRVRAPQRQRAEDAGARIFDAGVGDVRAADVHRLRQDAGLVQ